MTTIEIGYNRRCWAKFKVVGGLSMEELALLEDREQSDSSEVVELLRKLYEEGRLNFETEEQDDMPEMFAEYVETALQYIDREDAS